MSGTVSVVADIGGTNTRVALARGSRVDPGSIRRFRNAEARGLGDVLERYLAETDAKPEAACVAMAGPVENGRGTLTNLDWLVDGATVSVATGADRVAVLNDLQAQGHALAHLGPDALIRILPGQDAPADAPRLVVGVGTGLNAAPVYSAGGASHVHPAEAGHLTLAARDETEAGLRDFIARNHPRPGVEDALSGRGFERIHAFLCDRDGEGTPLDAAGIMAAAESDPRAAEAIALFTRLLGTYVSDLAMVILPRGGIYLCGGVAQHFARALQTPEFARAFTDKGRFSGFMERFPVHLITDDYAALTGCAAYLSERSD